MAAFFARLSLLLAASAILRSQTGPLSDDVLQLSKIRRTALASLSTVPSYTCLETIERRTRVSARQAYKLVDVVQLEVAEFGERELFAWPGQKNFEDKDGQMLGLSSSGEFFAHLKGVMAGSAAIHFASKEDCEGSPCLRYDFRIAQPFTHWTLSNGRYTGAVAERGSFWADPESATLYRLDIQAEDIPAELGMRSTEIDIRYGKTNLTDGRPGTNGYLFSQSQSFQLPQSFSLNVTLNSGAENRNDASFTHCREYQAESKIIEDAALETGPEPEVQEITLPAHLSVKVTLTAPVRSGVSHVGDRVDAVVDKEVSVKGGILVPRGAQVIGRVRRMERYSEPYEYWIAALEFTDVVFTQDGRTQHARFTGAMQFYDPVPGLKQEIATERATSADPGGFGAVQRVEREKLFTQQLPGVGTFLVQGPSLTLSKGFHMTWMTTALDR